VFQAVTHILQYVKPSGCGPTPAVQYRYTNRVQVLPAIQHEGRVLLWAKSGRRVRLTNHLHLMTMLRMSGAVPHLTLWHTLGLHSFHILHLYLHYLTVKRYSQIKERFCKLRCRCSDVRCVASWHRTSASYRRVAGSRTVFPLYRKYVSAGTHRDSCNVRYTVQDTPWQL